MQPILYGEGTESPKEVAPLRGEELGRARYAADEAEKAYKAAARQRNLLLRDYLMVGLNIPLNELVLATMEEPNG